MPFVLSVKILRTGFYILFIFKPPYRYFTESLDVRGEADNYLKAFRVVTSPRKGKILLRFLIDHLDNPEHHPLVIDCNTPTPKGIRLSNIQQTISPLIT